VYHLVVRTRPKSTNQGAGEPIHIFRELLSKLRIVTASTRSRQSVVETVNVEANDGIGLGVSEQSESNPKVEDFLDPLIDCWVEHDIAQRWVVPGSPTR
jgi:hypothetical protein